MSTNSIKLAQLIREEIGDLSSSKNSFKVESDLIDSLIENLSKRDTYRYQSYLSIPNTTLFMMCLLQEIYYEDKDFDVMKLRKEIMVDGSFLNELSAETAQLIFEIYVENEGKIVTLETSKLSAEALRTLEFICKIINKYDIMGSVISLSYFLKSKLLICEKEDYYKKIPFINDELRYKAIEASVQLDYYFEKLIKIFRKARQLFVEENKKQYKKDKRIIDKFSDLLKVLESNKADTITEIDDELYQHMHNKARIRYLSLIIANRGSKFRQLRDKNNSLEQTIQLDDIDQILLKYNLCGNSLTAEAKELLKKVETTKIIKALELFKTFKLPLAELLNNGLAEVIFYADEQMTTIVNVLALCEKRIIDLEFIKKHIVIMLKEDVYEGDRFLPLYDKLMANISIFKRFNPDFISNEFYRPEMLLDIPKELEKQLTLLNKYRHGMSITNCQFLVTPKVFDLLDYFIENNYDIRMLNNIDILGVPINFVIKRLEIVKSLEPIMTEEIIQCCFNSVPYLPSDISLDEYIANDTEQFINPDYKYLLDTELSNVIDDEIARIDSVARLSKRYRSSNLSVYDLDGIIISRPKVLRYLSLLIRYYGMDNINELIFNAIIYGKVLNTDELSTIKKCLASINLNINTKILEK